MSLVRRSHWSWAALGLWLANASVALAIAVSLLFGPEIADRAWAQGIHVTPAQAAMHAALMAGGFTHHHGATPLPAGHTATQGDGPSLQPASAGSTWGTPLMQAIDSAPPAMSAPGCCSLLPGDEPLPAGADLVPESPPPEAA